MFRLCRSLEDVEIPAGVTEIERYAFTNCNGLRKRIEIPDGVTTIGDSAFNSCYCIPAFIIPASITTIGTGAFASCSGLHEIHFRGSVPPAVSGASAFTGLPEICKIYVPSGSLAAYQAAANYPDSSVYTYIEE